MLAFADGKGRTTLRPAATLAMRGGAATGEGSTSAGAMRWERVMLASGLGQRMTMGELAIVLPKPLRGNEI